MKNTKILALLLVVAVAVGCGGPAGTTKEGDKKTEVKKTSDHVHGKGPNDGVVFDLGKYHAEFTVDHDKMECTVLVVSEDDKDARPVPVAAKELTLITRETKTKEGKVVPPMTIKLVPRDEKAGKAARFVGTDPGLGNVADFEGTVVGEIDGKQSKGEFKE